MPYDKTHYVTAPVLRRILSKCNITQFPKPGKYICLDYAYGDMGDRVILINNYGGRRYVVHTSHEVYTHSWLRWDNWLKE